MKSHDFLIEKLRDSDYDIDLIDHGDVCELAFCLAAERDEARKLAEHYRDNGVGAFVQGRLPWEEK